MQIGNNVPDEKTIWLFKEQLKEKNLSNKLYALFPAQLMNNGIIAYNNVDKLIIDLFGQRYMDIYLILEGVLG